MNEKIKKQLYAEKNPLLAKVLVTLCIVIILLWSSTAIDTSNMSASGFAIAKNILAGIANPDLDLLFAPGTSGVGYLLLETICIAFLGTIVGAVIALPLSFLGASNIVPKPIAWVSRTFVMAVRTIPTFIYGLMFIRVSGPGAFAGLMTMGVCSVGMVSKMYIETIEDLDIRILESLDAAGCNTFQKIRYGVLPQLMPDFASTMIYRFDMNLRDATVLGLVGAGGIGAPLIFAMNTSKWNQVGSILIGLMVLVLIVEAISSRIRTKLTRG